MAMLIFALLIFVLLYDPLRQFFQLLILPLYAYGIMGLIVALWVLTTRIAWRTSLFERSLGLEPLRTDIDLSPTSKKKTTLVTQQVDAIRATVV
jgi:hypothetical protein